MLLQQPLHAFKLTTLHLGMAMIVKAVGRVRPISPRAVRRWISSTTLNVRLVNRRSMVNVRTSMTEAMSTLRDTEPTEMVSAAHANWACTPQAQISHHMLKSSASTVLTSMRATLSLPKVFAGAKDNPMHLTNKSSSYTFTTEDCPSTSNKLVRTVTDMTCVSKFALSQLPTSPTRLATTCSAPSRRTHALKHVSISPTRTRANGTKRMALAIKIVTPLRCIGAPLSNVKGRLVSMEASPTPMLSTLPRSGSWMTNHTSTLTARRSTSTSTTLSLTITTRRMTRATTALYTSTAPSITSSVSPIGAASSVPLPRTPPRRLRLATIASTTQ